MENIKSPQDFFILWAF